MKETPANAESIAHYFPRHTMKVWSRQDVEELMRARRDFALLKNFNSLIPLAYKSDLASYYLLYTFGGWYTDLNNFFVSEPPDVSECTMYLFKDVHDEPAPWSISTSMFYSRAGSPSLKRAIEMVQFNCDNRVLGNTPLCVTGPTLLGSAIAAIGLVPGVNYHTGEFVHRGSDKVFETREKELLALYKPNNIAHGESGVPGGNNYTELWHQGRVFK
ncbi:glycosyltransferase [Aurantimicrobium minutum]|uniref:glycosyltransferase n=1 Tax=Aurantimicrobium minutum TaxID=708131 RepID=UPI002475B000|nr:glycosyltransferase [Aurantimicrobium minutum]